MLQRLGYKLKFKDEQGVRYPSEMWVKTASHGHFEQHLCFDTIHGGSWTFDCFAKEFVYDSECDWTTQERCDFDPASKEFVSCKVGRWHRCPAILDVDECRAVADHIASLEQERKRRLAEGEDE